MTALLEQPTQPAPVNPDRLDRHAVRFLLDHKLGRLVTEDPISREPAVTSVHYVADGDGSFLT
ncbi:MAG: hypothetical protein ACYTGQ_08365, partial [Planctomycetota bacterium]